MDIYTRTLAPRFTKLLAKRESELRTILRPTGDYAAPTPEAQAREVLDFKDMAVEETQSVVDEAKADHALEELEQVVAARKRLAEQTYGECLDCGEPIDLRRLIALPATPFCTGCQDIHEHGRGVGARRATLHINKGKTS
ncbi:MAG TPA: TraR/DksA family transcriptional regulator [Ramlibacter sp.]|nr:TraR/DksA family transcriptional regulator [Ramlibacter sp.]